jgi:acylphosphatase
MTGSPVAVRVVVIGRVQGVWFRQSCAEEARAAGVTGWVRNLADGSVEAWLEGSRPDVNRVAGWCRTGPPRSRVDRLEVHDEQPEGLATFTVRP